MKKQESSVRGLMDSLSAGYRNMDSGISNKETIRSRENERIGNLIVILIVCGFILFLGGILLLVNLYL